MELCTYVHAFIPKKRKKNQFQGTEQRSSVPLEFVCSGLQTNMIVVPVFVTVLPKKWLRIIASFCVEPGKALRVFLYWNLFHLVADLVIIIYFFVANTLKYDAGYAWNSAPMFTFAGFLIRISILANVYQTYTEYKDKI